MSRTSAQSRRRYHPSDKWLDSPSLEEELACLATLGIEGLRTFWASRFSDELPPALSRDLLGRLIAWRIQAGRLGGLDIATSKLLTRFAKGHVEPARRLSIGVVLVREYRGVSHEVVVAPRGYRWQDTIHPSLSAVARAITGTAWNGPRFFELRDEGQGKDGERLHRVPRPEASAESTLRTPRTAGLPKVRP
jgi:Protein of unknown function (DUF2924)